MTNTPISRELLSDAQRVELPAELFGMRSYPFKVEPTIYAMARRLAQGYQGGYWDLYRLSNGGWYMHPTSEVAYEVLSMNGFSGTMSADALGITACLFALSHLSFGGDRLAEICAGLYHHLRGFATEHAEAMVILAAID